MKQLFLKTTLTKKKKNINYYKLYLGPEHTGHFVQPHVAGHCGGDIYSRRKPLFSSFGEHTAVCGSSVRQAVARPRHRQSVCIHNIHVAATCRPSVLGSATMRGHMWLNKVASVLGPLNYIFCGPWNKWQTQTMGPIITVIIENQHIIVVCINFITLNLKLFKWFVSKNMFCQLRWWLRKYSYDKPLNIIYEG